MIDWCFMPLSTVFKSYHGDSSFYSCLSWVSQVLGWGSDVSFPRTLPRKTWRIKPRTPGLQVKHFTTEIRRTPKPCVNWSSDMQNIGQQRTISMQVSLTQCIQFLSCTIWIFFIGKSTTDMSFDPGQPAGIA